MDKPNSTTPNAEELTLLYDIILTRFKRIMIENIPEKDTQALRQILQTGTQQDLFVFAREKIPSLAEKYVNGLNDLRTTLHKRINKYGN